ncbi:methyltransferase domain-containing protein [Salinimicrobium sp. MT39]|uniref:Methyltransferase domain-containing protein n=1 Tax=Salinimicrobium profundisediminis TaxID=2994553 RepID=A0A9X3CV80_9FLAO|nr:methyltransferase domain-containing protein [Salinimicrobium profundisediminis]MCX2837482.1 methyltransferase domain-containing protein [Salinimicrobium profundisediminis]
MEESITDKTGKDTLQIISEANGFNNWMFQTILPFTKGKILEIGSGLGNISNFFLQTEREIMLTDLRKEYCELLEVQFNSKINLLGIDQVDLVHPEFDYVYKEYLGKFDTVFSLNVIEHIENDHLAIGNCKKLLNKNGHLIILVPSYQKLYNKFDKELGHYRRYTLENLSELFLENNFEILHKQYFNVMGIVGWYFSGSILKNKSIPSSQMKLYEKLVPAWKMLDKIVKNRVGLSSIVVGRK